MREQKLGGLFYVDSVFYLRFSDSAPSMHAGSQSSAAQDSANRTQFYTHSLSNVSTSAVRTHSPSANQCVAQSNHDAQLQAFSVVNPHSGYLNDYYYYNAAANPIDSMHQLHQRLFDGSSVSGNPSVRNFPLQYSMNALFGNALHAAQNGAAPLHNSAAQNQLIAAQNNLAAFSKFGDVARNNNNAGKFDEQVANGNFRYCFPDAAALQNSAVPQADLKSPHVLNGACAVSPTETIGSNPSFYSQNVNSAPASMFYQKQVIPWMRPRTAVGKLPFSLFNMSTSLF